MYDLSNMGNKNALQRGNEKMKMIKKNVAATEI